MSGVTIKVTNKTKLFNALRRVAPTMKSNLKKALAKSGEEWVSKAQALAPVGATGKLRESIGYTFGKAPDGSLSQASQVIRSGTPAITIFAGNKEAFYVRFVEFGTAGGTFGSRSDQQGRKVKRTHPGTTAQPFFFPAYRILRTRIKSRLSRAMSQSIKQAGFTQK